MLPGPTIINPIKHGTIIGEELTIITLGEAIIIMAGEQIPIPIPIPTLGALNRRQIIGISLPTILGELTTMALGELREEWEE